MLNHIAIMGRFTKDPELRKTPADVSVVSFTIACDRDGKDAGVDFIDVTAWRHNADFIAENFKKGTPIIVEGRLQIRNWTDRDGNNRRNAEIVAENVYFAERRALNPEV